MATTTPASPPGTRSAPSSPVPISPPIPILTRITNTRKATTMKLLLTLGPVLVLHMSLSAATTIDAAHQYAYGANLGWMDWRGDTANGAIIGEYVCSGYIYSANTGWINLGSGA